MNELGFERVEEALHRGIVVAVGLAAHRSGDAGGGQRRAIVVRGILHAPIGMVDQAGARPLPPCSFRVASVQTKSSEPSAISLIAAQ